MSSSPTNSGPIYLPKLQALANANENLAVLVLMQDQAMRGAIALREAKGIAAHPKADVVALADHGLPRGEALMQMYLETRADMHREPIARLIRAGRSLSLCAGDLERVAGRLEARRKDMDMPSFARAQQVMGERLATLIEGARTLEESGAVPVHHTDQLNALTQRPTGPLEPYLDKAMAVLQSRERGAVRERVAA
jgi:hypothetical protein